MKSFTSGKLIFGALSLCALFGATSALAQEYTLRVDVPFQFQAGEKLYPAGDYRFTVDNAVHTLKIQPDGKKPMAMVPLAQSNEWRSGPAPENGVVRFTNLDGKHVLNGVWGPNSSTGSITYRPKAGKVLQSGN